MSTSPSHQPAANPIQILYQQPSSRWNLSGYIMNIIKNIVQKLQELPVPQCPTKQYTTGSQILEIIDKAKPHRKVEIENDPNDEDNDVIGEVCWSKIRKSPVLEENFWPSIRKHILADDPDAIPIKAICTICWDELRVTCISPDDKLDFGFVAPCGHIMCRVCWPREYNPSHSPFQDCRKCPVCHLSLACFHCRKDCDKVVIPTHGGKAGIESFPETGPECGREYRPWCKDCAGPGDGFWFENIEECESTDSSSDRSVLLTLR
ncbi:hypothetical protein FVER53590_11650 [Fusarium verticillioides]|nr:hypothetical protein FVER53590_11650 [Fusarium verticillioides]